MKIGKTSESKEAIQRKLYTGPAPVKVLAVNPTKDEMEKLFGWKPEKEPVYEGEKDGRKWTNITFFVKPEVEGVEDIIPLKFFLQDSTRTKKDGSGLQVINVYGETTWLTNEDFDNQVIPEGRNFSPEGVRPAYSGEAELLDFVKTLLCVPNRLVYNQESKVWEEIENPEEALAQFEHIQDFFEGNIEELRELINIYPENKIKVWLGVERTDTNNTYQTFYSGKFARNSARKVDFIMNSITKSKEAGMLQNVDFGDSTFKEYTETPTQFEKPQKAVSTEEVKNKWVRK